jgi:biotin carboxylase
MMDRIIILGAGIMQWPAIRIAGEMGLERHVLDGNADAPYKGAGEHFHHIDLRDKEKILELASELKELPGRLGVMTAGTDFSTSVAYVTEKLGLPGHSYEAALNATDKARMRAAFSKAGVPSPAWVVVDEAALRDWGALRGGSPAEGVAEDLRGERSGRAEGADDSDRSAGLERGGDFPLHLSPSLIDESGNWRFPLVVKPCDNMGGRGCSRVDNEDDLKAAVADAIQFSPTGRAIVEEFMDGWEFSIDAIVTDGWLYECGFADRHIFFPPYFVEMGHTIPSNVDYASKQELMRCFDAGVRALGLKTGAVKGDLKLTRKGPMIGEIAARLSGGYMSGWTFPYASGFEATKMVIEMAMGMERSRPPERDDWASAERAILSIPGTVRTVLGVEEAKKMTGIRDVFMRVSPGSKVTFPKNNVEKCGNVISRSRYRRDAADAALKAANSILIRLEPGNPETDAFLAQPRDTVFPPSAIKDYPDGRRLDYTGREPHEISKIVYAMTGLRPPFSPGLDQAMMRGGYQGAVYYMDTHLGSANHEFSPPVTVGFYG